MCGPGAGVSIGRGGRGRAQRGKVRLEGQGEWMEPGFALGRRREREPAANRLRAVDWAPARPRPRVTGRPSFPCGELPTNTRVAVMQKPLLSGVGALAAAAIAISVPVGLEAQTRSLSWTETTQL